MVRTFPDKPVVPPRPLLPYPKLNLFSYPACSDGVGQAAPGAAEDNAGNVPSGRLLQECLFCSPLHSHPSQWPRTPILVVTGLQVLGPSCKGRFGGFLVSFCFVLFTSGTKACVFLSLSRPREWIGPTIPLFNPLL